MQERRSEVRMLCADMIQVSWKEPAGNRRKAMGILEDISSSGACIQMENPVPVGADLRWSSPKQDFTGRVRYCVYREIGYFVGVEFESRSHWSKKTYKPQHLLDLEQLMSKAK